MIHSGMVIITEYGSLPSALFPIQKKSSGTTTSHAIKEVKNHFSSWQANRNACTSYWRNYNFISKTFMPTWERHLSAPEMIYIQIRIQMFLFSTKSWGRFLLKECTRKHSYTHKYQRIWGALRSTAPRKKGKKGQKII